MGKKMIYYTHTKKDNLKSYPTLLKGMGDSPLGLIGNVNHYLCNEEDKQFQSQCNRTTSSNLPT